MLISCARGREGINSYVDVPVNDRVSGQVGRRRHISVRYDDGVAIGGQLVPSKRTMSISMCLVTRFSESLVYSAVPCGQCFPFGQDKPIRIVLFRAGVRRRLLKNKVGALPGGIDLESPDAVQQQVHGAEPLARHLAILEGCLPLIADVRIGHNRTLQVRKCSFGAGANGLLNIRQNE